MIRNLVGAELLILLVVVMLIFGVKRVPELGRSLGGASKSFARGSRRMPTTTSYVSSA
ncbi:MAG: hypothetical protein AVDCRST_MAG78-3041 [uncultured Rubrobacteraceae bacterium]|uniref:Twin-arginine translocation protein TatA n=1 Tax=uncultured Rubrobacteraceae bacterium TaxID=349277 RepID=A0A6J4QM80_9ACTN|nr:MAG: hypothetical protein AVDCRST_MAG78-3041 [uncultured Rubrobacteraceae bacterium]